MVSAAIDGAKDVLAGDTTVLALSGQTDPEALKTGSCPNHQVRRLAAGANNHLRFEL
jgi:hypothetical protein